MKQDFLDYIQETFEFSDTELQDFERALSTPLKKTIRVNTNKISIEDFKKLAKKNEWVLTETPLGKNMFYIDREDTSIALGNTLEHITWYFYVQELAASSSPYYLSDDTVGQESQLILDMSASPGWKTTQLAEYFPESTIIANEIDRARMRQLHENTDRLWVKNCFVTNYDGRFFANFPELFDKILLDAPCSGEGTAYKTDDALKYWNIKNIKRIAKLQFQLLESAFISLKVWGELVYSTCTLNRLENEEILNKLTDTYGEYFRIVSLKNSPSIPLDEVEEKSPSLGEGFGESHLIRAWPHTNNTWGFFVAKLRKKDSIPEEILKKQKKLQQNTQGFEKVSNTEEKTILKFLEEFFWFNLKGKFYTYRNEIYYTEKNIDFIWENFFLYKSWIKIGTLESWIFEPNFFLWTNFWIFKKNTILMSSSDIDILFKGQEIEASSFFHKEKIEWGLSDWFYQIIQDGIPAGIVRIKNGQMKSLLESRFYRK